MVERLAHTCTRTLERVHTNMYIKGTQMQQRGGRGPVLLDLIIPRARHNEGAEKE